MGETLYSKVGKSCFAEDFWEGRREEENRR